MRISNKASGEKWTAVMDGSTFKLFTEKITKNIKQFIEDEIEKELGFKTRFTLDMNIYSNVSLDDDGNFIHELVSVDSESICEELPLPNGKGMVKLSWR